MRRRKYKVKKMTLLAYLSFIVLCIGMIYPFICIVSVSFTSAEEINRRGFWIWPERIDTSAYAYLSMDPSSILEAYGTTIFVAIVGTVVGGIVSALYAYAISRASFPLRRPLAFFAMFTMFFSGGMASKYIIIVSVLKMKNSIWALILPIAFSVMNMIIMRAYFEQLPYGVAESAKIDGASEYKIFTQIMIPLAKPALATICLTLFVNYWNAYYEAMMYMDTDSYVTIQLLLQRLLLNASFYKTLASSGMMSELVKDIPSDALCMAVCVISVMPMLLIFPSFQKYFVKGMAIGAVKE